MSSENETLGTALPKEIQRCTRLLEQYKALGDVGRFGYAMISADIQRANEATAEGDVIGMLEAYKVLKGCK